MNQVTLLCAESFNDVSLLGALTSCPLLKERGYQTEILYCGDENEITNSLAYYSDWRKLGFLRSTRSVL